MHLNWHLTGRLKYGEIIFRHYILVFQSSESQRNFILNNQNNVLDLIFTNDWRARVTHPAKYLLASDSYHPLLEISTTLPRLGNLSLPSSQKYNFRLADYFSMRNYFNLE